MSKRKSLEKKLAAAISVVNLLNAAAPIALPYVSLTQDLSMEGGHAEPTADGVVPLLYGTAEAKSTVVTKGKTVSNATLNSGDTQTVAKGGKTKYTTVNNGGTQTVENGGRAENTTVNSGGRQIVSSGGTIIGGTVNSGGKLLMSNGSRILGGKNTINAGGVVSGGTLSYSGGQVQQDVYGSASKVNIGIGGTQTVWNGGVATSTRVNGVMQVVRAGGTAEFTSVEGGNQLVVGIAKSTTVMKDGALTLEDGGTAIGAIVSGKLVFYEKNTKKPGTAQAQDVSLRGGTLRVEGAGTVAGTLSGYGSLVIFSRAATESAFNDAAVVVSGGDMNVQDEATTTGKGNLYANTISVTSGTKLTAGGNVSATGLAF